MAADRAGQMLFAVPGQEYETGKAISQGREEGALPAAADLVRLRSENLIVYTHI
jgi:hypothetical protein